MDIIKKLRKLADIYIVFLKLGSISFGGGFAIVSLMEKEIVQKRKWVDKETIIDIFAISQSLPGAIALNSSAFVGYAIAGIPGSVVALLGNLTSPVIIIISLTLLFSKFRSIPAIEAAFKGIYPAIVALVAYAGYVVGKTSIIDMLGLIIMLASLLLSVFFNIPPIPLILAGAFLGIIIITTKYQISCNVNKYKRGDD